jgi:hypothetical protein
MAVRKADERRRPGSSNHVRIANGLADGPSTGHLCGEIIVATEP